MCPGVAVNIRGNMFVYTCPCICEGACPCVFVCAFPHPWMASSAWSAWSAYPPQRPSSQSSWWRHVCALKSVSVWHVFKAGRYAHGLSPSPSTHPPPSALSRTPIPIIRSFMLFHATSHCSSFPLSRPPLPLSLPLSLSSL